MTRTIRSFGNEIIGTIEEDCNGNKTVKAFGGRILGYYNSSDDTTRTFGQKIIAHGDIADGFLFEFIRK